MLFTSVSSVEDFILKHDELMALVNVAEI